VDSVHVPSFLSFASVIFLNFQPFHNYRRLSVIFPPSIYSVVLHRRFGPSSYLLSMFSDFQFNIPFTLRVMMSTRFLCLGGSMHSRFTKLFVFRHSSSVADLVHVWLSSAFIFLLFACLRAKSDVPPRQCTWVNCNLLLICKVQRIHSPLYCTGGINPIFQLFG
jgi:hypothetical protein